MTRRYSENSEQSVSKVEKSINNLHNAITLLEVNKTNKLRVSSVDIVINGDELMYSLKVERLEQGSFTQGEMIEAINDARLIERGKINEEEAQQWFKTNFPERL